MAKERRGAANGVNKSEAIRTVAASLGAGARPRDIRLALKEQGLEVSAALVTNVLTRSAKKKPGVKTPAAAAGRSTGENVSLAVLLQAKKLVEQAGSLAKARRALESLAKLM